MSGLGTYAFLNAKVRGKLSKLISPAQYKELVRAPDVLSACLVLRGTEYRDLIQDIVSAADLPRIEAALAEHLIAAHREVRDVAKGHVPRFIEELLRQYEVENLKVLLRAWNAREEKSFIYRERICNEIPVDALLEAQSLEEIIVLLGETPYRKPLTLAREDYERTGSPFPLEVALDRELYEATWKVVGELPAVDRKIASRLLGIEADLLNITWMMRFKRYYGLGLADVIKAMVPGGLRIKEEFVREVYPGRDEASLMTALLTGVYGSRPPQVPAMKEVRGFERLEEFLKKTYLQQLRQALGGYPFTIGTVIAYLRLKKAEVSNLITILNAKALSLPPEEVETSIVRV
ncbi:MAG: V-type ATPase subunit [bacterium]|nr:V-type ATPase subunit [bacterium]